MNASAVSPTTNAARARTLDAVPPDPFRSTSINWGRVSCNAGASPARTPTRTDAPTATPSTTPSTRTSSRRGMSAGASDCNALTHHGATSTASVPPRAARSAASVKRCHTSSPRPPPSAARMASSRCRAIPRARRSVARFAQAMRSARSTAASSAVRAGLTGPTTSSSSGCTSMRQPRCSRIRSEMRGPSTSRSACAPRRFAPGLSRPMTDSQMMSRRSSIPSNAIESSTSAWRSNGKWKSAGMIPPMV